MTQATMGKFVFVAETAAEDFMEWKTLFENFLLLAVIDKAESAGTDGATAGKIVAYRHLVNAGDKLAVKMLRTFDDPTTATYATLMEKMEAYCSPKDTAAALFKFDTLSQASNESIQDWVIRLKPAAVAAGILTTNLSKEILRRIAVGTNSEEVRMKALDTDATLDGLLKWEATRAAKAKCTSAHISSSSYDVNFVSNKQNKPTYGRNEGSSKKCGRCGYEYPHKDNRCPADGKTCKTCGKPNHFSSVCRLGQPPGRVGSSGGEKGKGSEAKWNTRQFGNGAGNEAGTRKKVYNVGTKQQEEASAEESPVDYGEAFQYFCAWMKNNSDGSGGGGSGNPSCSGN
jgi:hypothetical protein